MSAPAIDWDAAVRAATRTAPTGPKISQLDAARAVAELRDASRTAELHVRDVTSLGRGLPVQDGMVVDRPGWISATVEGMAVLTEPMTAKLAAQIEAKRKKPSKAAALQRASGVAAQPIGSVLGYLSGKVLGQFDPFVPDPAHPDQPGRLLLVAPNIVKAERALGVPPSDFRLWVCLHESTHRLQFTAVPWLSEHFRGLVAEFADATDLDPGQFAERLRAALTARRVTGMSWIEATQNERQRAVFDRLLALMTLLEGHADHVMDAVGPSVVPSVTEIRAAFSKRRRRGAGPLDRIVRALLGMDLKLQQYERGSTFVAGVVDLVGMNGFNRVWTGPDTLPTRDEIGRPETWVARVCG